MFPELGIIGQSKHFAFSKHHIFRFLPVKQTSDLLMVMSNLYTLQQGSLVMSPKVKESIRISNILTGYFQRMFPATPLVKLGDTHFKKVSSFLSRFGSIPDMLELDHLTVSGDVTFGRGGRILLKYFIASYIVK